MSNRMIKLGNILTNVGKNRAYGKQIGKTNKLGQECRVKIEKFSKDQFKKTFIMVSQDGNVVQEKIIYEQPGVKYGSTKIGNNIISNFCKSSKRVGNNQAANNTFAKEITSEYKKFNKLGQIIYRHEITIKPGQKLNEIILQGIKNGKEFTSSHIINA